MAKAMRDYGDPVEKIAAISGLSMEEIAKLQLLMHTNVCIQTILYIFMTRIGRRPKEGGCGDAQEKD